MQAKNLKGGDRIRIRGQVVEVFDTYLVNGAGKFVVRIIDPQDGQVRPGRFIDPNAEFRLH